MLIVVIRLHPSLNFLLLPPLQLLLLVLLPLLVLDLSFDALAHLLLPLALHHFLPLLQELVPLLLLPHHVLLQPVLVRLEAGFLPHLLVLNLSFLHVHELRNLVSFVHLLLHEPLLHELHPT